MASTERSSPTVLRFILPKSLRSYQIELIADDSEEVVCISSTQVGKTYAYACKLLARMWGYKGPHPWWWCAPTYQQSRAAQRVMYAVTQSAGIRKNGPQPPFKANPPPPLELINGSVCEYRTWDNPDHLMGDPIAGAVIDEGSLLNEDGYSAITTRRSFTLGPLWWIGNPGDIVGGPFLKACNEAEERGKLHRWTWRTLYEELKASDELAAHRYKNFIEAQRRRMPDYQFKRVYEAEWMDRGSLPVYTFDRSEHVDGSVAYDPHLPIELACDFNVDPMCWVLGHHRGDAVWAFDEIAIPGGATTSEACDEFLRRHGEHKAGVVVYGDASGNSRSTKSRRSDYEIIRQRLGSLQNFSLDVPAANPPIQRRVDAVNGKLRASSGEITYLVHPRCRHLIEDRALVSWKPGTRDIDKRDKARTHASDADDYRIVRLFPIETVPKAIVSRVSRIAARDSIRLMRF